MNSSILRTASFFGMMAVILGAFGAHALKNIVDDHALQIWNKAVLYQFIHSFALLITGILCIEYPDKLLKLAGYFFASGILLFSGSLYIITLSKVIDVNLLWIGPLTPLGGLMLIAGWILIFLTVKHKKNPKSN